MLAGAGLRVWKRLSVLTWIGNGADVLSARALDWAQTDCRSLSEEETYNLNAVSVFIMAKICAISAGYIQMSKKP